MTSNDADQVLERLDEERRRIEKELDYSLAGAELEAISTFRLWSLAGLAVLLAIAMALDAKSLDMAEAARILATVAIASAGFHVATWAMLKVWLYVAHGR